MRSVSLQGEMEEKNKRLASELAESRKALALARVDADRVFELADELQSKNAELLTLKAGLAAADAPGGGHDDLEQERDALRQEIAALVSKQESFERDRESLELERAELESERVVLEDARRTLERQQHEFFPKSERRQSTAARR